MATGLPEGAPVPAEANDARRFGRNFGSTALAQLIAQVLTIVASLALAGTLDVATYGIFVFGFAFPSWFLLLVSLGLDEVITIEVAANRTRAARYLTTVTLVRVFMAVVAMAALWAATQFVLADPFARAVTLVLGASGVVTACAGTFASLMRAFEKFEYVALVTILERSITVGTVLFLLFTGHGLYDVCLVFLGGSLVGLALSAAIAKRSFAWFARGPDAGDVRRALRLAAPFGLFNAVGTFAFSSGLVLLTLMRGPEATGLFNAGFTLLLALFSFLSIVSIAALPMMSRINREHRGRLREVFHRIQRFAIVVGVPLTLGGWIYAGPIITTFYPIAFEPSAASFRVLLLSFGVETAAMGIGPALAATGHAKEKLYIGCAGAVVTIVLSVVLIPPFGLVGVASAFLLARITSAVLGGLVVRRYVGPLEVAGAMGRSLFAGFAMVLALLLVPGLSLWTGVALGGLVYFTTLWAVHGLPREDRVVMWNALRGALFR